MVRKMMVAMEMLTNKEGGDGFRLCLRKKLGRDGHTQRRRSVFFLGRR